MKRRNGMSARGRTLVSVAAVSGMILMAGCGGEGESGEAMARAPGGAPGAAGPPGGASDRATPVSVRIVETGDLQVTLRASANLRAREQVDVIPKQGGLLASVRVEEGARVSAGQELGRLDDAEWVLLAEQSEARARAATDAVDRARALAEQELISEQEVERLASDARVAEAEVGLARLRVENAVIRAPFAGTITHRYVERGQQVTTSAAAFGIADLDRLEAQIAVPEREAARIQVGQSARVILQEGAAPVATGRVERIRPVVDAGSGTVQVTIAVAANAGEVALRPGQFVNVDVVTETLTERITLPRTAVLVDGAAPRVFIIQENVAIEREVALGYSRGDQVEIQSGVEPGDTVVVVGQDNLRPMAAVRVMQRNGQPVTGGEQP